MAIKNTISFLAAAGLLPLTHAAVPTIDGFTLTWSDDFVGTANSLPNTANWQAVTGTSYPGGAANWGTNEIETVSYPCMCPHTRRPGTDFTTNTVHIEHRERRSDG